jgi:hypothetical protein
MGSHVPDKGEQMAGYYGYYSNVSRGRVEKNQDGLVPCIPQPDEPSRRYRKNWARFTVYPPLAGSSVRFVLVCDRLQQLSICARTRAGIEGVSSPGEFHPQALPDPDVNLSAHPAPIDQPISGFTQRLLP